MKLRNLSHRPVTATLVIDSLPELRTRSPRKGNVHVVVATIERNADQPRRMCNADSPRPRILPLDSASALPNRPFTAHLHQQDVWLFKERSVSGIAQPSTPSAGRRNGRGRWQAQSLGFRISIRHKVSHIVCGEKISSRDRKKPKNQNRSKIVYPPPFPQPLALKDNVRIEKIRLLAGIDKNLIRPKVPMIFPHNTLGSRAVLCIRSKILV